MSKTFFELRAEHEAKNDCFEAYNIDLGAFIDGTNDKAKRKIDPTKFYGKPLWSVRPKRVKVNLDALSKSELQSAQEVERKARAAQMAEMIRLDDAEQNELCVTSLLDSPEFIETPENKG